MDIHELRSPFSDSAADSIRSIHTRNSHPGNKRPLRTYILNGEYQRPWVRDKRLYRARIGNYIIWGFVTIAIALSAYYNYSETLKVRKFEYCLILDDRFESLDTSVWNAEVQINGFGNGVFDWTTTSSNNYFTDSEGLHIIPTLTNETTSITNEQIYNGYTLNLTRAGGDGSCTGTTNVECAIHSNRSEGIIIPPIRSARIHTKGHKTIRYGRVEVVAKLPKGNWIWPAIWMLPEKNIYGPWPVSGEIDLMESRGNDINYPLGGRNTMSSSLHWGPVPELDSYWRTTNARPMQRGDYSEGFHTFGLEWSQYEIYTYVDNPLQRVLSVSFPKDEDMWQRGHFAGDTVNSSLIVDPWSQTGRSNTPFDQPFYLILNVAVGGTNGYFPDAIGNKPWVNGGPAAMEFYEAIDQWYPTWPFGDRLNQRGMTVKSVKMWQEGSCN